MFERVNRVRSIIRFLEQRVPHYAPLIRDDLHLFRDEIVKASVGASISAVSGLIFACFFSIALLVTAWDHSYRIGVAWMICGVWGILATVGLWYALKSISGPAPFRLTGAALKRDHAGLFAVSDGK